MSSLVSVGVESFLYVLHAIYFSYDSRYHVMGTLTVIYDRPFCDHASFASAFFMVALCNRETIYIFMLWFVLSSSSSFFFFLA